MHFNQRLTWSDFPTRLFPPPHISFDAATGTSYSGDIDHGKWSLSVNFDREKSWVLFFKRNATLLAHEQGHFDISALGGRDILQQLPGKSPQEAQAIIIAVRNRVNIVQKLYDTSTDDGLFPTQQQQWLQAIAFLKASPTGTFADLEAWALQTFH